MSGASFWVSSWVPGPNQNLTLTPPLTLTLNELKKLTLPPILTLTLILNLNLNPKYTDLPKMPGPATVLKELTWTGAWLIAPFWTRGGVRWGYSHTATVRRLGVLLVGGISMLISLYFRVPRKPIDFLESIILIRYLESKAACCSS